MEYLKQNFSIYSWLNGILKKFFHTRARVGLFNILLNTAKSVYIYYSTEKLFENPSRQCN